MEDMDKELREAQELVEKSLAASNFHKTPEGRLIQDYIDRRVSVLLNKMTGSKPLSDREYLSMHGAITELKGFNVMIQVYTRQAKQAQERLNVLRQEARP